MNPMIKLLIVSMFAWLAPTMMVGAADNRPNILIIFADDLGYGDIGVHGGRAVPTPHLDALAASGVRCTSGYVTAPYCSPSRAGMLTGRAQTRFGHEFNPHVGKEAELGLPLDQRTIAQALREVGYSTGLVGKWHQGFDQAHHPNSRGFDEFFGFLVGGHNYALRSDADPEFGSAHSRNMIYRGNQLQKLDGFLTDLFTDEAIRYMESHRQAPWMLYLAYNAVHTPLEISQQVADRIPAEVTNPARRGYLALLLGLDDSIGRIMQHLRATGADKNTLIFFVSDNGGSGRKPYFATNTGVNRPLRGDKGQVLEGGIRVPYFVSWPGRLPAGRVYDHPVSTLDFFPTAMAAAGQPAPANLEGVDLLPYLAGTKESAPHATLSWRFGPQRAIRQGKWKLVDFRDFDAKSQSGWQLFDLEQDIGEQSDLSNQNPEKKNELIKLWQAWDSHNVSPKWHGTINEDPTAPPPKNAKVSSNDAKPIVDSALAAVGGQEKLLRIFRMKELFNSGETAEPVNSPKRTARTSVIELPGSWWLGKKERGVEPAKDDVRAWSLDLLVDPNSKIESLGKLTDEGKSCDGLSISGTVTPAMKLYFDQESHLLVRLDWREDFYRFSDWREHDGLKYAARTVIFKLKNGKAWFHHEITEIERLSERPAELK